MGRWVLANIIAWPVGIIIAIVLSYTIVNLFYPEETNLIVGICLGAVVAYSQQLIIKRYFKISAWWVFAAAIGIGLPVVIDSIVFELTGNDISITEIEIIDAAIVFFIGGLLTGLLQYNLFKSLTPKFIWWITISAFAWGLGWFGLMLGGLIHGLITGIAVLRLFELPVQVDLDKRE